MSQAAWDFYGLPIISIPSGFTSSGLPIGIQISGPRFGEAKVLALAHAYEQATDWHTRRPTLSNLSGGATPPDKRLELPSGR